MKTTLDELQAFMTIVNTGSITAAADRLEQTTSGVSRALNRLEAKLGATLLRRTTRRIELTEDGEVFLAHAQRVLEAVEDAEDQLAMRRQKPSGRLRVNAASPFMLHVVVPLVGDFRARYPDIELELQTSDQIIDLLEHRTDIAIRIGALRDSSLHARTLGGSRQRVLASPGYLKKHGTPSGASQLGQHSLLGYAPPDAQNRWPLRNPQGDTLRIVPSVRASSGETLRELALAGQGLVCLSDYLTSSDLSRGRLVQVLKRDTVEAQRPINAVYYRNTQLVRCFLDFLVGAMKV